MPGRGLGRTRPAHSLTVAVVGAALVEEGALRLQCVGGLTHHHLLQILDRQRGLEARGIDIAVERILAQPQPHGGGQQHIIDDFRRSRIEFLRLGHPAYEARGERAVGILLAHYNGESQRIEAKGKAIVAITKGAQEFVGEVLSLTTPTGAAIMATVVDEFGPLPAMTISAIGYGAGTRELPSQANVVRLIVGTAADLENLVADGRDISCQYPQTALPIDCNNLRCNLSAAGQVNDVE